MTNFLTSILGAITGANPAKKEPKTETTNTDTNEAKKLTEAYQSEAEYIVGEFGTGSKLSQKALQGSSLLIGVNNAKKVKVAELLGTLPIARVAQILRAADNDGGKPDGKVTPQERAKFMNGLVAQIENGASPERIQAGINAKFLKNGGEVSDAKKAEWIEEFKEFEISESAYTPKKANEKTDTAEATTDLSQYAPLITSLFGNLGKKSDSDNTDSIDATAQAQALALQKQQLEQQLQLQQQLQASTLNASSLGVGAFPTASPMATMPLAPLTLENFLPTNNPLLAGGNNVPTAMPAQNTFSVAPLPVVNTATQTPVASGFTFAQAQPAPTVATAPVTPSTAWTPPAPVAQAQAPVAPTLVAQAPALSNGGW